MSKKKSKDDGLTPLERIFGISVVAAQAKFDTLTPREQEVAALIANGVKTRAIAEQLGISPKTLDIHRGNVFRKFETKSIVAFANTCKLLEVHKMTADPAT